jgi:hypothetical protein
MRNQMTAMMRVLRCIGNGAIEALRNKRRCLRSLPDSTSSWALRPYEIAGAEFQSFNLRKILV